MTVGGRATDLDTPALLVDLDVLDSNIARMAGLFREHGVGWRPHTKAIKIPALGLLGRTVVHRHGPSDRLRMRDGRWVRG